MSPSSWMCLSVLIVFLLTFKVGSQFTGWYFSSSKICIILVSPLRPLVVFCCWKVRFGFGGFTCQRALLTPSLRASAISSPVGVSGPLTHLFFLHSPPLCLHLLLYGLILFITHFLYDIIPILHISSALCSCTADEGLHCRNVLLSNEICFVICSRKSVYSDNISHFLLY